MMHESTEIFSLFGFMLMYEIVWQIRILRRRFAKYKLYQIGDGIYCVQST